MYETTVLKILCFRLPKAIIPEKGLPDVVKTKEAKKILVAVSLS